MDALTVPADFDALDPISDYVLQAASLAGLAENSSYKLRLAVDEIVTNIIEHGYAGAVRPGLIGMQAQILPETLEIQIEDSGLPFDYHQAARPDLKAGLKDRQLGGLGIYLALLNLDQFLYERVNDCNRNRLIMRKN
jgi:anti-sigma regulatory factor (Ser/Thr protein kinase)